MKKSILLVLTLLFFVVSFTASVNADIMSWTDRQSLDDNLESKPIGDEGGWVETNISIPDDDRGDFGVSIDIQIEINIPFGSTFVRTNITTTYKLFLNWTKIRISKFINLNRNFSK